MTNVQLNELTIGQRMEHKFFPHALPITDLDFNYDTHICTMTLEDDKWITVIEIGITDEGKAISHGSFKTLPMLKEETK